MKYNVGTVTFPQDFKYIEVLKKGKPQHQKFDSFYLKHPPMELSKRAKIFSPFDALKGFNEAVASKEILYVDRKELNEEEIRELNTKLNLLHNLTHNSKMSRAHEIQSNITYFIPCTDVDNEAYMNKGCYETICGTVMVVDTTINKIIKIDDTEIPIQNISKIEL